MVRRDEPNRKAIYATAVAAYLAIAGIAWLMSGDPERALAVLVVATPCPLILAVPIAIVSGTASGVEAGCSTSAA